MDAAAAPHDRPPRRRWLQWRLKTMLLGLVVPAALLAWWLTPYLRERTIVNRLRAKGASVTTVPAGPPWLSKWFGQSALQRVTQINTSPAGAKIVDDDLAGIGLCELLERLELTGARVTGKSLPGLEQLPRLAWLDLTSTQVTLGELWDFQARWKRGTVVGDPGDDLYLSNNSAFEVDQLSHYGLIDALSTATRWRLATAQCRGRPDEVKQALNWQIAELDRIHRRAAALSGASKGLDWTPILLGLEVALADARLQQADLAGDAASQARQLAGAAERSERVFELLKPADKVAAFEDELVLGRTAFKLLLRRAQASRDPAQATRALALFDRWLIARWTSVGSPFSNYSQPGSVADEFACELELHRAGAQAARLSGDEADVDRHVRRLIELCTPPKHLYGSNAAQWPVAYARRLLEAEALAADLGKMPERRIGARQQWTARLSSMGSYVRKLYRRSVPGGESERWNYLRCLMAIERLEAEGARLLDAPLSTLDEPWADPAGK